MSNFQWATAHFPNPSVDYNLRLDNSAIRTPMDSGRVRQYARFSSADGWLTVGVKWQLSDEQYKLFQGIVEHKLNQGVDYFDIPLPVGNGLTTETVRFVANTIRAVYVEVMYWDVTAQLERKAQSLMTAEQVDDALDALNPE